MDEEFQSPCYRDWQCNAEYMIMIVLDAGQFQSPCYRDWQCNAEIDLSFLIALANFSPLVIGIGSVTDPSPCGQLPGNRRFQSPCYRDWQCNVPREMLITGSDGLFQSPCYRDWQCNESTENSIPALSVNFSPLVIGIGSVTPFILWPKQLYALNFSPLVIGIGSVT